MSLNIIDKDTGDSILGDIHEREVDLPDEKGQNFNFIVEVINTNFTKPGLYAVEIKIDGKNIGEIPLKLFESKMDSFGAPS